MTGGSGWPWGRADSGLGGKDARGFEHGSPGDEASAAPLLKEQPLSPVQSRVVEDNVPAASRSDGENVETSSFGGTWSSSSNKGSTDDLPVGACAAGVRDAFVPKLISREAVKYDVVPAGVGSQSKLPSQKQAQVFLKWLLPVAILGLAITVGPVIKLLFGEGHPYGRLLIGFLGATPLWLLVVALFFGPMVSSAVTYGYHYLRFRGWQETPDLASERAGVTRPLTHVVVVCTYKEPTDVLLRTFESIAAQKGLHSAPIAVLAAEERDQSRHASFEEIQKLCKGRLSHTWMTSHELMDGEPAGKSSNENFAVREVYRKVVEEFGLSPFEVMITIADADSILSSSYLAHVESAFINEADGRRLIYKGPLNVYRNFMEAGLLVQCMELARCHMDMFHPLSSVPYPYSNYSLTLGMAQEIGFWTPDVMPEDIHTANKAMVNSFGSRVTVTVPAVICNDLVPSVKERYVQAKRHQWGSVTETAWTLTLLKDTNMRFAAWSQVWSSECARAGSWMGACGTTAQMLIQLVIFISLKEHVHALPANATISFALLGIGAMIQWACFWAAELTYWNTVMRAFPVERPSVFRWILLICVMPFATFVNNILFFIVPTFHAMLHATFVSHDLAYVTAPKGDAARQRLPTDTPPV